MMGPTRPSLLRLILHEVLSSLPGRRKFTQLEPPEDPFDLLNQSIYTGALNTKIMLKLRDRVLGLFLWIAWFGLGVYFWWFTEVPLFDYLIGTLVWGLIFIFTVLGIPITRAIFRFRNQP
ncbi:unannotated protein [freshwater metagenome]|jgi:hypothetical protein|uniref:Unannotated protein n=1 Tax=freshwater metagenome TaxID=449393 RepID=A0A6J6DZN4_9ZZZZ